MVPKEAIVIATYVTSDIHGQYDMFMELIDKIDLKQTDTLYVLGDILDRGPHPIKVLKKLMEMPNAICIVGNHELMALECLEFLMKEITDMSSEEEIKKLKEQLKLKCALDILFKNADVINNPNNFIVVRNLVTNELNIISTDYNRCLNFGISNTYMYNDDFENFEPIEIDLKSMQNEFNIMRSNIYDDKAKEVLEKSIYNLKNSLKNNKYLWNDNAINIESEDFRL